MKRIARRVTIGDLEILLSRMKIFGGTLNLVTEEEDGSYYVVFTSKSELIEGATECKSSLSELPSL